MRTASTRVIGPIVKPRSIDDVPILPSPCGRHVRGRSAAIARSPIAGCRRRSQRRVGVDHHRRAAHAGARGHRPCEVVGLRFDPLSVQQALRAPMCAVTASRLRRGWSHNRRRGGSRLRTADELRNTVVTSASGRPVFSGRDVAEGLMATRAHVVCHLPVEDLRRATSRHDRRGQAEGTNATDVAHRVVEKLEAQGIARAVGRASRHHSGLW